MCAANATLIAAVSHSRATPLGPINLPMNEPTANNVVGTSRRDVIRASSNKIMTLSHNRPITASPIAASSQRSSIACSNRSPTASSSTMFKKGPCVAIPHIALTHVRTKAKRSCPLRRAKQRQRANVARAPIAMEVNPSAQILRLNSITRYPPRSGNAAFRLMHVVILKRNLPFQ